MLQSRYYFHSGQGKPATSMTEVICSSSCSDYANCSGIYADIYDSTF